MSGHDHARLEPRFSPFEFERAAAMFRAAGDPERLRMLELLSRGETCVSQIAATAGAPMSTVSQRLRLLRAEGLVTPRRDGRHIYYRLADERVAEMVLNVLEHVGH